MDNGGSGDRTLNRLPDDANLAAAVQKGRPSPGGEEARVVVHQPRGVGLMHTRPKPSEANYTHDKAPRRKSSTASETTFFL